MAKEQQEFSKYERARILGARALQISMDAPLLMKIDEKDLDNLSYDPLKIAQTELDSGVLPITVNRPMPERRDEKLKEIKIEELEKEDEERAKEQTGEGAEEKEEGEETAAIVSEEKTTETVELKSDEEVEESVEEEGVEEDLGGSGDEGGSDE
jgi:DNA-directed RNA polymerase subunit K